MSWTHQGIKIDVDSYANFVAKVNDVMISKSSLELAKTAIEGTLKAVNSARKIALPVVAILHLENDQWDDKKYAKRSVEHFTLTGINRTTTNLVLSGVPTGHDTSIVLPDTPHNVALLERYIELDQQFREIKRKAVGLSCQHSGRIQAANYEVNLARLESDYKKLKEKQDGH